MEWEREMAIRFREGKREARIEAAIELLKEHISPEIIAKCENLSLDEVLELQKQITITA